MNASLQNEIRLLKDMIYIEGMIIETFAWVELVRLGRGWAGCQYDRDDVHEY